MVSRVDDSVVRNIRDVDLLVRRSDMDAIVKVMGEGGFIHRSVSILGGKGRIEMFLDGPGAKARDGVHLIFSGEKVSPESLEPSPNVEEIDVSHSDFRLVDPGGTGSIVTQRESPDRSSPLEGHARNRDAG